MSAEDNSIMATLPRLADITRLPKNIVIGEPAEVSRRKAVKAYPKWIGGEEQMDRWIEDNLRYPREAFAKGLHELSPLCIHINAQGKVDSISMANNYPSTLADTIAWDLISRMPRWRPAIGLNGKPTGFWYYIGVYVDHPVLRERRHQKWEQYEKEHSNENIIYEWGEAMIQPEFPGGERAMYEWIDKNKIYPASIVADAVSGRVTVQFTVDRQGFIKNVKVARGKHPALDKEAVRVVSNFPRWIPGFGTQKTVDCNFVLPATFKLQ